MRDTRIILHDIRSVQNVGSIFRTADAAGVSNIYLTGYTPAPVDRFGRMRKDFVSVSLGAEKSVAWEQCADPSLVTDRLKKEGFFIVAVEQSEHSTDYKEITLPEKSAIIFGNETGGIPDALLREADSIAEIPMHGTKESLNVSVSLGIALFRMLDI